MTPADQANQAAAADLGIAPEAVTDVVVAAMHQDIPARDMQTPEGLGAFHKAEIAKWKAAGIKAP